MVLIKYSAIVRNLNLFLRKLLYVKHMAKNIIPTTLLLSDQK